MHCIVSVRARDYTKSALSRRVSFSSEAISRLGKQAVGNPGLKQKSKSAWPPRTRRRVRCAVLPCALRHACVYCGVLCCASPEESLSRATDRTAFARLPLGATREREIKLAELPRQARTKDRDYRETASDLILRCLCFFVTSPAVTRNLWSRDESNDSEMSSDCQL